MGKRSYNQKPITGTLEASASTLTDKINLDSLDIDGFFAIQILLTGDGTLKVEYLLSLVNNITGAPPDDDEFVVPTGVSDIVTAHTKISGTSGQDIYQFPAAGEVGLSGWIRYRLTETSTTDSVTYTIYDKIR